MKTSRWILAFALLAASQLLGFLLTELVFVSQLDPYLKKEIHARFDEPATRWHQQALQAKGNFRALMADIEKETHAEVHLSQADPIDALEGVGIAGIYFTLAEPPGVSISLLVGDDEVIEIGPMPGTLMITMLGIFVPMLILGLLAFVVMFMIIRTEHRPIRELLWEQSANRWLPTSSVAELMQHYAELERRNVSLEAAADRNIENQRDFLHGVAHEFRAPLARLRFAVDLEEPEASDRVEAIIEDMDELVTEILQYSRFRHGLFDVQSEQVDVAALLLKVARTLVSGDRLALVEGPGLNCPQVIVGDPGLIERCATNLIHNATRFAKSKILIDVRDAGDTVSLIVEDDGPGVPPGKRELIFDAFTRLDPSRDRNSGGTGLGLAIVAGIVDKLNGTVSADDASIGGARFVVELRKDVLISTAVPIA
ncbi:MAG: ATP-binding protein [Pseudomonadota bacterium]